MVAMTVGLKFGPWTIPGGLNHEATDGEQADEAAQGGRRVPVTIRKTRLQIETYA